MIHPLENEQFSVQINGIGAELCSFKSKSTGLEYIWQADPKVWGSTAPVLFPIIGALKGGSCEFEGKNYSIPKHGFIRHNKDLKVISKPQSQITFRYESSVESKRIYPFDFSFEITYALEGNILEVSHVIHNLGQGPMLFSLGGHPAFNCPLLPGEQYSDYYLEFDSEVNLETTILSKNGLLTDETFTVLQDSNTLPLHPELFANDALIFKDISSKKVVLKSKNHDHSVTLSYSDFTNLGIWAKYKAPFVCIEPWLGVTDHENSSGLLQEKEGIISLAAGKSFHANYAIEIK